MTHLEAVSRWIPPNSVGTEIGPGATPIPGLTPRPIYVDCFKAFGTEAVLADYYGHAGDLPFKDDSLDYVVSSHVLEHVANPVAALEEWYRVLRPEGIIYVVVPDRRFTWERRRPLTPVAHILSDYAAKASPCEATHVDEFVFNADWSVFNASALPEEEMREKSAFAQGMKEATARGEEINIHFHTFEPSTIEELLTTLKGWPVRRFNWELIRIEPHFPESCPNGVLAIIRINKGWLHKARADALRIQAKDDSSVLLRHGALSFEEWSRNTTGLGGVKAQKWPNQPVEPTSTAAPR